MASSKPESGIVHHLTCGICMEQYDRKKHVPKLLPCEHTFCLDCLNSIQVPRRQMECPVCRCKHSVPQKGFVTNRTVLDIVDALQQDGTQTAAKLKCSEHKNTESVLICMDCVTGLCPKCLKQSTHQGHCLEELSDAKNLIKTMFEEQIKKEQEGWDRTMTEVPYSVASFSKAEANINDIYDEINAATERWRKKQLSEIRHLKQQAITFENRIQTEREHLQSLLEHPNIDLETMITKVNEAQNKQDLDTGCIGTGQECNFEEQTESLMGNLHSVFSDERLITSRVLKRKAQHRIFTKVVRNSNRLVGCINGDIILYQFGIKTCELGHKCDWSEVCNRNDVQHDPHYRDSIEEMRKFYFLQWYSRWGGLWMLLIHIFICS